MKRTLIIDGTLVALVLIVGAWSWRGSARGAVAEAVASASGPLLRQGSPLNLPEELPADARKSGVRKVVLYASTGCPSCNDGAAFYGRISRALSTRRTAAFIVVGAEPREAVVTWLKGIDVKPARTFGGRDLGTYGVLFTPTLAIEENGVITDLVVGAMNDGEEERFMKRLMGDKGPGAFVKSIDFKEVDANIFGPQAFERGTILDIRDRGDFARAHRDRARNIPLNELITRGPAEIHPTESVLIDCTSTDREACRTAAANLTYLGINNVTVVFQGMPPERVR
jgi:rhodanese-related sulfurtransferase